MPPEILSLIFSNTFFRHPNGLDRVSAPWIASEVCARWRDVAVNSPALWTTINNQDPHLNINRLKAQLDRSRDLPLRVEFFCKTMNHATISELNMVGVLAQHSPRWETMFFGGQEVLYAHLEDFAPQFPLLRTLWLEMNLETSLSHSISVLFSAAPRLEVATVQLEQWRSPIALILPWHQLLQYRAAIEWTRLSVLASAVNLIECTLHLGDEPEPDLLKFGVVLLPRLLRLSFTDRDVLKHLETPALTELYDHDNEPVMEPTVFHCVSRTLQKLVLRSNMSSLSSVWAQIVGGLPQLKCFGHMEVLPMRPVLTFLASIFAHMSALEQLWLGFYNDVDVDEGGGTADELIDAMEGVDWKNCRLRTFRFCQFNRPLSQENLTRLRLLCEQGLDIQFAGFPHFHDELVPEALQI
ncbi:hypothetical protein FB45DRAFT_921970 [Roridomyces roridus]|uniref:F-box domain-containing protein n=1 Tax=Roridomyces roridus TaxID=1738132 RepID=A0AAD7BN40_9AGAR|nr:hypothetical protein FB45DRAFT_921970 [Roridomyces roridus]